MSQDLRGFFERQERKSQRQNVLAAALLTRGGLGYLARRGGLLFARVPLRVVLHAAEVIVIADFLELGVLGYLLIARSVAVALGALHWGALEPLRERVRVLAARREPAAVQLEVTRYVRIAVDWSIALLALLVAWYELAPRPFDGFSIVDAYAIGCTLRAIAETFTRTYHAGAFALRRVYRPFWSMMVVDVVEVGSIIALWPFLGPWGFALSQLLGGGCDALLSLHYTRRAYVALGLRAPRLREALSERARPEPGTWRKLVPPAFGNLASQVDALLITALALAGGSGADLSIAAGLHVLRPVLSLGTNWARLFYFDLSRLELPLQKLFRARLERLLLQAAPLFALAAALTGVLIDFALAGQVPGAPLVWLLPLFAARSVYATTQIQAFARGNHARLWCGGALVALAAFAVARSELPPSAVLLAAPVSLLIAGGVFVLGKPSSAPREQAAVLQPLGFLGALGELQGPVALQVLSLAPDCGARALAVARALVALPAARFVTRFDARCLLLACETPGVGRAELVRASAGALRDVQLVTEPSGREALAQCLTRGFLGEPPTTSRQQLLSQFRAEFPDGTVLDARSGALPRGIASPRELTHTLGTLGQLASGARPARRRGLRVAVYAPCGQAELVLILPRDADAARASELERLALGASVRDSVAQ